MVSIVSPDYTMRPYYFFKWGGSCVCLFACYLTNCGSSVIFSNLAFQSHHYCTYKTNCHRFGLSGLRKAGNFCERTGRNLSEKGGEKKGGRNTKKMPKKKVLSQSKSKIVLKVFPMEKVGMWLYAP